MRQQTLVDSESERYRNQSRLETLLLRMDQIIPWCDLRKVIIAVLSDAKRC